MLRAVAMAARLDFTIDPPIDAAIAAHRGEIARSAPARLIEEFYKLLRSGASERAFRMLAERRLLEPIAHELQKAPASGSGDRWPRSTRIARRFEETPDTLTNAILLGRCSCRSGHAGHCRRRRPDDELRKEPRLSLGMLPLARRDVERLRQILGLQRRLLDTRLSPRARRALMHRGPFREALTWLEIHGEAPEAVEHWRGFIEAAGVTRSATARAPKTAPPPRGGADGGGGDRSDRRPS